MSDVLPGSSPEYRFAAILPEPEPVKPVLKPVPPGCNSRQDSYTILPEFRNNRAELDHGVELDPAREAKRRRLEITGIYITGYAPRPWDREAHNLVLSENRAKALARYIRRHDGIAPRTAACRMARRGLGRVRRGIGRLSAALLGPDRIRELIGKPPATRTIASWHSAGWSPGDLPAAVERGLSSAAAQRVQGSNTCAISIWRRRGG